MRWVAWIMRPWLYFSLMSWFVAPIIDARRGARKRISRADLPLKRTLWFHAASVGELESLTPVIETMAAERRVETIVVSIFSHSAEATLDRNASHWRQKFSSITWVTGFSPRENEWDRIVRSLVPHLVGFVVARYEAWPGLWRALSLSQVKLAVVAAQERPSLRVIRDWLEGWGLAPPSVLFFIASEGEGKKLTALFPAAKLKIAADSRWDRVRERQKISAASRGEELLRQEVGLRSPFGVMAQVWPEDVAALASEVVDYPGFLLWVPHEVTPEAVQELTVELQKFFPAMTPSKMGVGHRLVAERGVLFEFYSRADWVYVGGGFGKGVHSTIEPAVFGVPVSCGPARAGSFPEIGFLENIGQLTQVTDRVSFRRWLASVGQGTTNKNAWLEQLPRQGAPTASIVRGCEAFFDLSASAP